jgi:D-serine deaminase-like pyridoxal phosphate-dependent protein
MISIFELETPVVLVDLDKAEANLKNAQDAADKAGIKLRPHIKTHKLPRFAKRQVELGAVGITVQKLGEAEVMADAGLTDLLLTFNIIGEKKRARLKALHDRVCRSGKTAGCVRRMRYRHGAVWRAVTRCSRGTGQENRGGAGAELCRPDDLSSSRKVQGSPAVAG